MRKILLAVDGSQSAQRATQQLIDSLKSHKDTPEIHLLTVHLPVPNIGTAGAMLGQEILDRYYREEGDAALAPSIALLNKAGVPFKQHRLVGDIAQGIVDSAKKLACENIVMGTRGHSAVANLVLGSIATKVLHLAHVPVTLVH